MRPHASNAFSLIIALLCVACPYMAAAQSVTLDLGDSPQDSTAARLIQLIVLMTVLSLAPSILIVMTSFLRIVIVLSFLRSAIGLPLKNPTIMA